MKHGWIELVWIGWVGTVWMAVAASGQTITVDEVFVDFAARVEVPARQSGAMSQVLVRQNEFVQTGQTLARLDDAAIVIRRRAALLRLESARLAATDVVEKQFAQTALAEAQAELDDSQATQDSVRGSISRNQLRRMRLAVQRGELEVARVDKDQRQAEIDQQLRTAELALIDQEMAERQCVSPIDGVVLVTHRDVGEWVQAGEPIVTIASAGQLTLQALVDAAQLDPATCVGLPVTIRWTEPPTGSREAASTGSLRGKVVSVDPNRLPNNRYRLHAEVANRRRISLGVDAADERAPGSVGGGATPWQLVPGMKVTMDIDASPAAVALRGSAPRGTVGSGSRR